ncbi:MAG TPA: M20/M25/M40 family metallo-hydrolase [Polyangiaceae bacterium]|nr:M20/M25/M40 family metallo-hydrolase [Polyangiaceae bacterium]
MPQNHAYTAVVWLLGAALCAVSAPACNEKRANRPVQPPVKSSVSARSVQAPAVSASAAVRPQVQLPADLDRDRIEKTLRSVARPRPPGSAHWKRVQAACVTALESAGYSVERQEYGSGVNVLGTKAAPNAKPERVVVSAHYDHIPACDGADDNASGVAALLEIARVLGQSRFERTLVVACWDEEERGLLGSRAYAERARARSERVVAAYSLDAIGFASSKPSSQRVPPGFGALFPELNARLEQRKHVGDFIAVVANGASGHVLGSLTRHARSVGLELFGLELASLHTLLLRDAYRSDHASFWAQDYAAVLLTDTANFRNPGYHCGQGPDSVSSIDFDFVRKVAQTTALSALELLGPIEAP